MNMWAGSLGRFIVRYSMSLWMAVSSARRMFCNPGSLVESSILPVGL